MTCTSMKFLLLNPAKERAEFPQISRAAHQPRRRGGSSVRVPPHRQSPLRFTRSFPSTRTRSFSAQLSELEGRVSHVQFLPSANASMKGISSRREVNWNKSFITWNGPVTSPERHELRLLACTWATVITLIGDF